MTNFDVFKFARIAARAADGKLGENIVAFDVRRASTLADVFLIVTGTTHIHIRAIEDAIREDLRAAGVNLMRTDGQRGHMWRVLDYGFLMVHIMDQKTREFYAMEKLWEHGKKIQWEEKKPEPIPVKAKKKPAKKLAKRAPAKKKAAPKKKPKNKRR